MKNYVKNHENNEKMMKNYEKNNEHNEKIMKHYEKKQWTQWENDEPLCKKTMKTMRKSWKTM